jgi:hypothetical protein
MSRLPPELLLRIGAYFTHNRDLCALALVSRAWRVVAQEWLLKTPCFNLTYIDRYLWELGHHVHLHAQIRTVEIVSSSKGRVRLRTRVLFPRPEYLATSAPENWNGEFLRRCSEIIRYYAADRVGLNEWTTALGNDCVPALFGVLVCILPNLRALKLGNAWMMDFPIFGCVLAPDVNSNNSWLPPHWKHSFLDVVRDQLLSRLEILEVPVDLKTWMISGDVNTIFDFRKFVNLRVLDASLGVLWSNAPRTPPNPQDLLPPSLELLRICDAPRNTPVFVRSITVGKLAGHIPVLDRIEIYYESSSNLMLKPLPSCPYRQLDILEDIRRDCTAAQLAVYMLFPADEIFSWDDEGGPWHTRIVHGDDSMVWRNTVKRHMLFSECYNSRASHLNLESGETIFNPSFEIEWDRDGNQVIVA